MWYLWLQIIFLLALAALCGAGIMYWWMRGRYEDVTESYSTLVSETDRKSPDIMERGDLEKRLDTLTTKIDALENADFSALESQILSLSGEISDSEPDLSRMMTELQSISEEARRSEGFLQSIQGRLTALESDEASIDREHKQRELLVQRIDKMETDFHDVLSASISQLHTVLNEKTDLDLDPVLTRLDQLQDPINQLPTLHPTIATLAKQTHDLADHQTLEIKSEVARLEQRLSTISDTMLRPIQKDVEAAAAKTPAVDTITQRLEERLNAIEDQISRSQQMFRPINEKIDELMPAAAANLSNHRSLSVLDQKVLGVEESIIGIKQRMDQIGAILTTLDQRVDTTTVQARLDQTAHELAAIRTGLPTEAAFEPLEQGLARLQQMIFSLRERDLSGLNGAIRAIENRVDFVGVENRLTSIEYGLAATHHMLRSRLEQSAELPPAPQRDPFREPPRDSAFRSDPLPVAPEAPLDPIDAVRPKDGTGNLLLEPGFGQADNLEKIRGIGPMLRQLLNDTGVFYYWQVAEWTEEDVASIDAILPGYQGRISRDRWVEQARELASLPGAARRPQPFGKNAD
ncbi:MAG: hypothetical protein AAFV59_03690 [Pseudomonadota bacterium]